MAVTGPKDFLARIAAEERERHPAPARPAAPGAARTQDEEEFRRRSRLALEARLEEFRVAWGLPFRFTVASAYSPRQRPGTTGLNHIVPREAYADGRFRREAGQPLCSTREFWGLSPLVAVPPHRTDMESLSICKGCRERARAIAAKGRRSGP